MRLLTDGPAGIRARKQTQRAVHRLPGADWAGARFDVQLARRVALALGSGVKAKGQNVVFAPILNPVRVAEGGRLFEGLGEDPRDLRGVG